MSPRRRSTLTFVVVAALLAIAGGVWFFLISPEGARRKAAKAADPPATRSAAPGAIGGGGGGDATVDGLPIFEADPPGRLVLEGQVVDAEDRPVGDAVVGLSANPRRVVRTEADGSFSFDGLVARTYVVAAVKGDGFAGPATVRVTAKAEPLILKLAAAGALEVTVVAQEDRKPVSGARVELRDEEVAAGNTGDDGKTTLHAVSRGRHLIVASAPGFATTNAPLISTGQPGGVQKQVVELRRGATVSGTVVDPDGVAVAGARVRVTALGRAGFGPGLRREAGAVTDEHGRWTFAALPAGAVRFAGSDDRHGPASSEPVTLDGKTAVDGVVITLEAGARIAGHVTLTGGAPAVGAAVRVSVARGGGRRGRTAVVEPPRQVYTDDKGAFEVAGLSRAPLELVATGETASSQTQSVDLTEQPEQAGIMLILDVDGQIAGTVVDGKGQPVAGAQVTAIAGGEGPGGGRRGRGGGGGGGPGGRGRGQQDVSDSAGHFVLHGLPDGTYRLIASRSGDPMPFLALAGGGGDSAIVAQVGDQDVRLLLKDDGQVKGRVLFSDGSAPSSFAVGAGFGPGTTFTGDGSFVLDLPAGGVTLSITGPELLQKSVPADIEPGQLTDVGTISVDKGRALIGKVVDSNGAPVSGATVYAGAVLRGSGNSVAASGDTFAGTGVQTTTTGDDGGFTLGSLGAGSLVIAADHPTAGRSNMVRVPPAPGAGEIDLQLQLPGSLDGKVTSAGQPLPGAQVTAAARQAALGTFVVRADETGAYHFDALAPDDYQITARPGAVGRGTMQSGTVTIVAAQPARLDLDVPAGDITVVASVTTPATSAQIFLFSGSVAATTAAQLAAANAARGDGSAHVGYSFGGAAARLANVVPGAYSGCTVALPASVQSPRDMAQILDKLDVLPCVCAPVTVAPAPDTQTINLAVGAAPTL